MAKKKEKKQPKRKLRVLFNSNAPWSISGYGQQVAEILPRMVDEGYDVGCISFYGLEGAKINYQGITCYPKIAHPWGSDAIEPHSKDFKADIVITLQDIWVLLPEHLRAIKRWIPIVPIDMQPTPPGILQRLRMAYRIISYSPFGHRQLKDEGLHSTYIQHTVDTKVFKKLEKKDIRKQLNIPNDIFLFGMVAANKDNPPRKCFQEVMDAFFKFQEKYPKSGIYFHTVLQHKNGFPIETYAKYLGIAEKIYKIPDYDSMFSVGKKEMPKIYSMMDCLLCPSLNEGFGVPIIEAQSCEVPVIVNDFTAMPDLIVDDVTGYKTDLIYKRFTPLGSYVGVPDWRSILDRMERVYHANRDWMGKKAREHIQKEYDSDVIYKKKWSPFLEKLEKEIYKT